VATLKDEANKTNEEFKKLRDTQQESAKKALVYEG